MRDTVLMRKMDVRLKNESVIIVAGPSASGKTVFVTNLVRYKNELFREPIPHVKWFYSVNGGHPPAGVTAIKGLVDGWVDLINPWDMVVIDDLLVETANDKTLTAAFTRLAHHKPCTLVYITQNLFHKSADSRTRSLNMHYLVLMKNPRDATQVSYIARQMYPKASTALIEAFQSVTNNTPYSYMLFDFHQDTPTELRIRTKIFPNDEVHPIFLINTP